MTPPPAHRSARAGIVHFLRRHPTVWPLLALVLLVVLNAATTPRFVHLELRDGRLHGPLINILRDACPVMLLATGMTLVIATGGIDLSVGSVMALAGTVAALLLMSADSAVPVPAVLGWLRGGEPTGVALAIVAAFLVAVALGVWNGLLVTYVRLQPIVATLILLVAGRGIAQTLTSDQKVSFAAPAFEQLGVGYLLGLPVPVYLAAGVAVAVFLVLRKTVVGMYIEAIGGNLDAARMAGLKVHGVRILVYAFSAFCAAVAGMIVTADIKLADVANCGLYMELDAILAVVIGGTSLAGGRPRLLGSLVGAIIMQMLSTTLTMHSVPTGSQLVIKATVAVAVCLIQTPFLAGVARRLLRRRGAAA
jgi:ribose/xylose/arabinose/galactoside ABC-type transport system permease subunit